MVLLAGMVGSVVGGMLLDGGGWWLVDGKWCAAKWLIGECSSLGP